MRWLVDECVDAGLAARLRAEGHDVIYIAEARPGETDRQVLALALQGDRLLLTEDKDFGDLVFRSRMEVPGVVLLRLRQQEPHFKWKRLEAAIRQFSDSLFGRYVVIDDARMRSRPLLKSIR